jgi:hypothetical protein
MIYKANKAIFCFRRDAAVRRAMHCVFMGLK